MVAINTEEQRARARARLREGQALRKQRSDHWRQQVSMLLLPWAVRSSGTLDLGVVVLAPSGILIVTVERRVEQVVVGKLLVLRDRGGNKWMERLI